MATIPKINLNLRVKSVKSNVKVIIMNAKNQNAKKQYVKNVRRRNNEKILL